MNKITTTFLILLLNFTAFAQVEHRVCGAMDHLHQLDQIDPTYAVQRQLIENHTQQYLANPTKQRTVITIPVVVHVVYNTASQNISDAQIQSQINVLNADFRRLNVDFVNTPGPFQGVSADCEVQFVLARRNPNGDSTNGITRTQTIVTSFTFNDNVKKSQFGGKDPWPTTDYLNIWVCKLSSGLLGYAQFPGGPVLTDGVVCSYRAFGTVGAVLAPFNKGRTATHEIGHYFNLFHIWGDDGGSCNGTDLVNDTPNQGAENYGCPTYPRLSCNNTPSGDMFMNFMDYTDDACMSMFTAGQKARMDALFTNGGARYSLLTSLGGEYPTGGGIACGTPTNLTATNITPSSITLNWDAIATASSYSIQLRPIGSNSWINYTSSTVSYTITGLNANTTYEYQIQATCTNGTGQYSSLFSFQTAIAAPQTCGIPISLSVSNLQHNSATAEWQAVQDATQYTVRLRELGDTNWMSFTSQTNQFAFQNLIPLTGYEYNVSATCPYGTSDFSSSNFLNTLASPAPSCSNNYEPNDSKETAVAIEKNTIIASMLTSETDNDYFTFSTTALQPKFKITLSNLPGDYDLKIYNNNGIQIGSSQNGRLQGESIISNNTNIAGTYAIRVLGYNGKFDSINCYRLYVETSSADFKAELGSIEDDPSKQDIEIYPNPTNNTLNTNYYATGQKEVVYTLYNSFGQRVFTKSLTTQAGLNILKIDVAHMTNGIYLLEIRDSEEQKMQKISVQH
jgi:hypothetical protein